MTSLIPLIFLFSFPLCVNAYIPGTVPDFPARQLAAGKLLIASENINGGVFTKSVILLTHHNRHGTTGLIINRASELQVNDAVPGLVKDGKARRLFIGGPVEQAILSVLVKAKNEAEGLKRIMPGIYLDFRIGIGNADKYFSSDIEMVRFYSGYAGWGEGQLETEIDSGAWYLLKGDAAILFDDSPNTLWEKLLRKAQGK